MTKKYLYVDIDGFETEALSYESTDFTNAGGGGNENKPVLLDASGLIDASMIDDADIAHDSTSGMAASTGHTAFPLLDGTRAFTGNQAMGSNKITGLANGVNSDDAATFGQLTAAFNDMDRKDSVRLVSSSNVALTGEQTIDGVLTSANRVLLVGQTDASENGIYVTAAGAWARSSDADSDSEVTSGLMTTIEEGSVNAGELYLLGTADPIVVDTTNLTFIKLNHQIYTSSLGVELVGSDFRVDLLASGGLKLTGNEMGVEPADFAGAGLVDDGADNMAIDWSTAFNDAKAVKASDLASNANGFGASIIGVEDANGYFVATDQEGVNNEIFESISNAGVNYTVGAGGVTIGDLVFVSANDTASKYATITSASRVPGIALTTESAAGTVKVLANDTVVDGVLTALGVTAGDTIFWDGTSLVSSIPATTGQYVYQAGIAKNADDLHVEVQFRKKNA